MEGVGGSGWERVRKVEGVGGRLGEGMGDWEREELCVMLTVSNMYLSELCPARLDYL